MNKKYMPPDEHFEHVCRFKPSKKELGLLKRIYSLEKDLNMCCFLEASAIMHDVNYAFVKCIRDSRYNRASVSPF